MPFFLTDGGFRDTYGSLGTQTKKCETSPRPSEGRLCARPGPMATQIHTQQESRLVPGRSVILFYFLYMLCRHYGPLASAVKSLQVQKIFQSVTFDSLNAVRRGLVILNLTFIHTCTAVLGM